MATVNIPADLDAHLEDLVRRAGGTKDALVSEAVRRMLEDEEDLALLTERLSHPATRLSLEQVERNLSLAD